ncbi:tripartite tricarboxylate transporter permease [Paraburkholderia sp. ZP32-5]|uniref:tripartite tricarboxylate transporter permease n=1 Tax=Paraburkholderia sp. ZP32-5 TaxID=2883245 RepID=UPI001F3158B4|nr:tripartite tricarboxylate transporter permease [Paraburkholderia sp. ZP32-5]
MLHLLLNGLVTALQWHNLEVIALSTLLGLWIGVIPGLGPVMAMAILFPFTFFMEPLAGLLMLASIHVAGTYSGSISAITINVPGDPASAATTFDGYAMARQGKARVAMGISITASFIGALVGSFTLIAASKPLAAVALHFGPAENFALAVLGLCVVAAASTGSTSKALLMGALGLAISFVGTDDVLGYPRFTFGFVELESKIGFVPVLIGLFAVAELMHLMVAGGKISESGQLHGRLSDGVREVFRHPAALARGSLIGVICGVIPGVGAVTANLLAHMFETRVAREPGRFGKGAPEGIIAPEASNNACVHAALIPTLTLGIPASGGTALVLVAVTIHGLRPGPMLFSSQPDLVYGFFAGMLVGAVLFTVFGLLFARWLALITLAPAPLLVPCLLVVSLIGAYAYNQSFLDVAWAVIFGVVGFMARRYGFPVVGLVMGLLLGGLTETSFHQSLEISDGSYLIFLQQPIAATILGLAALLVVGSGLLDARSRKALSVANLDEA